MYIIIIMNNRSLYLFVITRSLYLFVITTLSELPQPCRREEAVVISSSEGDAQDNSVDNMKFSIDNIISHLSGIRLLPVYDSFTSSPFTQWYFIIQQFLV